MPHLGAFRRDQPTLLSRPATDPQEIENSIAHRYVSDSVDGLAARDEDQPTISIDVLDSDLI
jgi:hypothetical protein